MPPWIVAVRAISTLPDESMRILSAEEDLLKIVLSAPDGDWTINPPAPEEENRVLLPKSCSQLDVMLRLPDESMLIFVPADVANNILSLLLLY